MAETVRCTLTSKGRFIGVILAWFGVGLVFFPILPGLWIMVEPAFDVQNWALFWQDTQLLPAMMATLVSAIIGCLGALFLCLMVILGLFPGARWNRYQRRLPVFLALPHVAFAIGCFFLFATNGWFVRLVSASGLGFLAGSGEGLSDPYGLGLGLVLAIKESWFLLWVASAQLKRADLYPQLLVMHSLGYGSLQSKWLVLVPQLLPSLGWGIVAVLAYNMSVVDVAIILGPGNPHPLAVLAWQWLNTPELNIQAKGMIAALVLVGCFAAATLVGSVIWQGLRHGVFGCSGRRYLLSATLPFLVLTRAMSLIGVMVIAILTAWSLATIWFYPALLPMDWSLVVWRDADFSPFLTSLTVALVSSVMGVFITVFWLEWGASRFGVFLWWPLFLPALPLVIGQYSLLLKLGFDGTLSAIIWSHLLWVIPYMSLVLVPAYRAVDPRLLTSARSLGLSACQVLFLVKWPSLIRPLLAAWAIGFSVSIAQYLPSLYSGAGRFSTITTEAVALSSGGNPRILAVQALLQFFLPGMVFLIVALFGLFTGHYRQGLR